MGQLEVFNKLYLAALDQGYIDEFKLLVQKGDNEIYMNWLVASGAYRVLLFSRDFVECLHEYFAIQGVGLDDEEDVDQLFRRIVNEPIPLGGFLRKAIMEIFDQPKDPEPSEE